MARLQHDTEQNSTKSWSLSLNISSWAHLEPNLIPHIVSETVPGPKPREPDGRGISFMVGHSSQVTLCPVVFERRFPS